MNHKYYKMILKAFCSMVLVLALVAGANAMPAYAATNGIYVADAHSHYKHPQTGVIEDSGGESSAVLGQSMTDSATYDRALVEVDTQGNTYITLRMQLMDNVQDPQFWVDGEAVSATIMQENFGELSEDNTSDFRIKVPSENSIIRIKMYVVPMGREVIFYMTVSNLQAGSEDFVTSVEVTEGAQSLEPVAEESAVAVGATEVQETVEEVSVAETVQGTEEETLGLQEYDADGNLIGAEIEEEVVAEENVQVSSQPPMALLVVTIVLATVAVCVTIWFVLTGKKK